jgi:CelD/BcsL family acetyltransferase involved in cellulose biosynthesis
MPGDEILAPAYHHRAEIDALIRAGLDVVFYGAGGDLAPDQQELKDLAGPRCRALMVVHVLGFPQDAAFWRRWCDDRGLLLIENASDAWSATVAEQPVGSYGDLSVFCPYKTIPVPHISASVIRMRGEGGAAAAEQDASSLTEVTQRPSRRASALLHRLTEDAAGLRRENYRLLLEELVDLVPAPFDVLPEGASPLGFPVEVPDRTALMERLARLRIDGVDFWPTPHPSMTPEEGSTTVHPCRSVVTLPVHQGLTIDDLDRIADAARPSPRRRQELRVEHIDDFDALRSEWVDLALGTRNVFATWEWNRTWWEHFGDGRQLALTALRNDNGSLRAILPLFLWRERPFTIARFVGHVAGDHLEPVCAPVDRSDVGRALRGLLRTAGWDLLVGERLPGGDAWGKRLAGRTLHREGSPVMYLDGSWEDATSRWSPGLRKQLRRLERRMHAEHDVRITVVDDRSDLEGGLDTLFGLHRARWPEGTKFEQREPFHRDFARQAFDKGWLVLRITEADGVPVAAKLNFRYSGVELSYQSGWHPDFAGYSLGTLQLLHAIRSAHADGMEEYRFLRGGESYKYRFAHADAGLETVLLHRASLPGAVAAAGVALAESPVPRRLRNGVRAGG